MTQEFKFELGQKVKIESGREGKVETNSISFKGLEPRVGVNYFNDQGEKKFDWFEESELEPIEK